MSSTRQNAPGARRGTKRFIWAALFFTLFLSPVSAQTAIWLETLLEQPEISWEEAAAFTLEAAERTDIPDSQSAFDYAAEQKWLPENAAAEAPVRLDGLAGLLMRAFDLKGGIFYSLFGNPRYAYRELVYREVIQGKRDPAMSVSGSDFLFMIGRVLSIKEDDKLSEEEIKVRAEREALAEEINVELASLTTTRARATTEGVTISLTNIQFLANSAELSASEKEKLLRISEVLKRIPDRRLLVTGHTALAGTVSERQRTSLERAQSVAAYLEELGVRSFGDIFFQGHGAERPVADNDTPEGMAANRRVEITILD